MKKVNNLWNQRYSTDEFVYGKDPNLFFASSLKSMAPGKILLPGEGEGRNAIYAAGLGWKVEAFDQSCAGADKARLLALERDVQIDYLVCELEKFTFKKDHYDAAGLVFFHAPAPVRKQLHHSVVEALKPGGMVILEAFHISQLGNDSGGPQSPEMLFSKEILKEDFSTLKVEWMEETQVVLDEGIYHSGPANVVRFRGIKR